MTSWSFKSWGSKIFLLVCFCSIFLQTWGDVFEYEISQYEFLKMSFSCWTSFQNRNSQQARKPWPAQN